MTLVYCSSVLEHVDSPAAGLREMCRVLVPGGAAFIITMNRHRISASGYNGEYNLPFFTWLPPVVRGSFAFHHLHYDPRLADTQGQQRTENPAPAEGSGTTFTVSTVAVNPLEGRQGACTLPQAISSEYRTREGV